MRLALRTLFWLVLAAAVAIGWGVEHWRAAAKLAETKQQRLWPFEWEPERGPSKDSLARRAKLAELEQLSDADLMAWCRGPHSEHWPDFDREYDLGLTEMVRRCLVEELQRLYDEQMTGMRDEPNNAKLLLALRRAQGRPDPLKIHVEFQHEDWQHRPIIHPQMKATIENVDVGRERVHLDEGCDDRSGRRTRWRVHLTDEQGVRAPDANFISFGEGGGIGSSPTLAFGERGRWGNLLDARSYVAPQSSGKYQLQLIHGVNHWDSIAGEPDLTGLILLKSEPIDIIVTVPPRAGTISVVPLMAVLAIGGVWGVVRVLRRRSQGGDEPSLDSRHRFSWHDAIAWTVVAALAIGWWCDSWRLFHQIRASQSDRDSDWTMRLAE